MTCKRCGGLLDWCKYCNKRLKEEEDNEGDNYPLQDNGKEEE